MNDLAYLMALFAEREFDIEVELVLDDGSTHPAIITTLFNADDEITWRPADAVVAVGEYIEGPYTGRPVIIPDPDVETLKLFVH